MPVVEAQVALYDDLVDGEMREVLVGDKKALLSRVKGEYYATGHLCTHYKAPLAKGILSEDGRLVCQWHGACFNVKSGDIEDAPGVDALAKYTVRVADGKVFVQADSEALAAGRRAPTVKKAGSARDKRTFVILGGGAAGHTAAETLREDGFQGQIVLVSKESVLPIDRIKLSKSTKFEVDKLLLRSPKYFDEAAIQVKLGTSATHLDTASQNITLSSGEKLHYDKLLIATGADPRNFWPNSAAMNNVVVLRGFDDAAKLEAAVAANPKPRIVTVGSSFIAMEAAATFVKTAESVVVIGMEKVPFERVLGEKIGAAMQKLHEEKGVQFKMNAVVDTFETADGGASCSGLKLKTGEFIPADIVIIGAGVVPATAAFKTALNIEKDGSIVADEYLAVVGQQNIYIAGDIARFPYSYNSGSSDPNHLVRIEHWSVAQQQGRVAAHNMLDGKQKFTTVPYFWTNQYGKGLRYCGHALSYDDVIIDGNLDALEFVAFFTKGEDVLAVASMSRDPEVTQASELLRLGLMPKASEIKAGKSVMDIATCGKYPPKELIQRANAAIPQKPAAAPPASVPDAKIAPSNAGGNDKMVLFLIGAVVVAIVAYFLAFRK